MTQTQAEPHTRKRQLNALEPIDWCVGVYFILTGILLLARGWDSDWQLPMLVRVLFFVGIAVVRRLPKPTRRFWVFLRVAYPMLLYPYFYTELATLNQLVTTSRFDAVVVAWEQAVFRSMPSVELREWIPWWPFAEFVHLGYLAYYFMPPFVVLTLTFKNEMLAAAESVTVITLTFIACYAWFILFPVEGPFHYLTPPAPETVGPFLPHVTQGIIEGGSSKGTAFPSSHVAVSSAALLQAIHYNRMAARVLWVLVPALALGAIYGGYHYAIDALAGAILALLVNPAARALFRKLKGHQERVDMERSAA